MSEVKRSISLKEFASKLPPGLIQGPGAGRYVFGSRLADTVPYLVEPGAEPVISEKDISNTPVSTQAFVFTFDMSNEEHKKEYEKIIDAIASGWYKLVFVERRWDESIKNMRIYIEVLERHRVIKSVSEYDRILSQMSGNSFSFIK
jgi:hypothetical protein